MHDAALIETLKALAHPVRWRILAALATAEERNVGEIEAATGIGQPGLSQQLGVLRKAGLVETRKEAKLVFYAIADDQIKSILSRIAELCGAASAPAIQPAGAETAAPGVASFARIF
jgi:DNA-binding transcriptional ArsR family regulator